MHDGVMAVESRLADCSILLKNHASSKILEWNSSIISRTINLIFYIHKVIVNCMCVYPCVCVVLMKNEVLRYEIYFTLNPLRFKIVQYGLLVEHLNSKKVCSDKA